MLLPFKTSSTRKTILFFLVLLCLSFVDLSFGEDLYSQAPGEISPAAPRMVYPESYGGDSMLNHRFLIWIFIQQHFYLGSFILGVPMIAWLLEMFAAFYRKRNLNEAKTLDRLASDMMRIGLPFYPFTVITGLILLGGFLMLYPQFFQYLSGLFQPVYYIYALCFFLENLLFYGYAYTWDRFHDEKKKWHLALGLLTCLNGVMIIGLANALMSFMMSPQGVDAQGRFTGNLWAIIQTPFWNPLNIHRVLASMMFAGVVIAAFAAYSMLTTSDPAKRAHYDQMGHIAIMIGITNLFLLPFAGYWFAKEVFIFRQRMGMTLMGGELTWLFVVQAMLVGFIFMTVIYYIWQGTARMEGSERYHYVVKYLLMTVLVSFLIWTTPHTLPATQGEFQAMGGTQHPIVGYYGTMSAKNTAINTIILTCGLCFMIFKRCNKIITVTWKRWGNIALVVIFAAAEVAILFLGIYGISIPAHVRVALAFPQFMITIGALIIGYGLNLVMLRGAKIIGPIQWGRLPTAGAIAIFALAFFITTTMSLMGYIRSSVRLNWHIVEIMEDVTPWANTLSFFNGLGMVLLNVFLFLCVSVLIFRVANIQVSVLFSQPKPSPVTVLRPNGIDPAG
jgi:hypothetical protein